MAAFFVLEFIHYISLS